MIKGIEQNTKKTGRFEVVLLLPPPLPLPPPLVAFRFWCQTSWNTFVVTAKLMPKLIECAICFDACVATVPTIPATSKGQHHDPIIAGKENRIVKTTVARFPFPPEEEELKGGCSFETKKDEFRIFVVFEKICISIKSWTTRGEETKQQARGRGLMREKNSKMKQK